MSTTPSTTTATAAPTGPSAAAPSAAAAAVPRPPRPVPQWWRDTAGAATWLSVLVVIALWLAGGGLTDRALRRRGAHVARAADRPGRLRPAARPGAADGADPAGGAGLRAGRAGPAPPAGRLHVVQPDARARRADHPRATRPRPARRPGAAVSTWSSTTPGMLLARRRHASPWSWSSSPRSGPPARRLRYESWHLIHLYAYLGVGLALPHQLWTGHRLPRLAGSPASTGGPCTPPRWPRSWSAGSALPRPPHLRHRLVVDRGRRGAPGVVSVDRARPAPAPAAGARPASSSLWRFLDGPGWSRAHPVLAVRGPATAGCLRITVDHLGDGSRRPGRCGPAPGCSSRAPTAG